MEGWVESLLPKHQSAIRLLRLQYEFQREYESDETLLVCNIIPTLECIDISDCYRGELFREQILARERKQGLKVIGVTR